MSTPDESGHDWDAELAALSAGQQVTPGVDPGTIPAQRGPADTSFEVTLDDTTTGADTRPVPAPAFASPAVLGTETRMPVLPPALRSRAAFRAEARRVLGRWWHQVRYHGLRSPAYLAAGSWFAAKGVFVIAGKQMRWWWLSESEGLRRAAGDANDPDTWHKLHREARRVRAWRGSVLGAELVAVGAAGTMLALAGPWWLDGLAAAIIGPILARVGRGAGKRITSPAVLTPRHRKLNYDIVQRAYQVAGLSNPDKRDSAVTFPPPGMARDPLGQGSRVVVDLPWGKTYADVLAAKGKLASGLDVSLNQVFLTPDATSNRRHVLFVADRDPLAIPAGTTPMVSGKRTDIWQPAPFGLDERGRAVAVLLLWNSILIGAQPRKGKTFSARLLALYAALDPFVRLTVVDGKMSPDWDKFRLVAHRVVVGTVPNSRDSDPIEHLLDALREIKAHILEVNDALSKLPVDECPEGKLAPELCRKYPKLRPWGLIVEEFQNYFETDSQETNKEVAGLLSYILAVGPSAGVFLICCSQKPSGVGAGDVGRLFNRFRDNHAVRFALKCGNRIVSEAVLGGDAYAEGYDASTLPVGKEYLGVGYLYGAADETPTVRTYLADHADAEKILTAARRHREAAGTLSGEAAGEDMARATRDVLADAGAMYEAGETFLSWQTLAGRLAERLPEHYANTNQDAVSAELRELKVPSKAGRDKSLADPKDRPRGAYLTDIAAAAERRSAGGN
jgi:S-DNA-T family DNA segregation ATPase FtsK/SpoIIIE